MRGIDLFDMAVFFGTLLIVLGGLWWMLRRNARDLACLERELKASPPSERSSGATGDE
jgi:hypothetical protein